MSPLDAKAPQADAAFDYTKVQQKIATNPLNSAWVAANAGSGKTYVLARRVIRLLLSGNKPSQLLCLTFTKAAAAEMSNRVFEILGEWTVMGEAELAKEIEDLTGEKPLALDLVRARQLFALSLDTPGGLKIQTIHAFCDALLHQFPLEANVPAHFEQIDTPEQNNILNEAKRNVILASLGGTSISAEFSAELADAFATIRNFASEGAIENALKELIHKSDEFLQWTKGDVAKAMIPLFERFDFNFETSVEAICELALEKCNISEAQWLAAAPEATKAKAPLYEALLASKNTIDRFYALTEILLNKDGTRPKGGLGKAVMASLNIDDDQLSLERDIIVKGLNNIKSLHALNASFDLFKIAQAILVEYSNLKQRRGLLDFSDLILKAADLLNRKDITAWVQFKLDRGIDHVLVDEAQDTSPLQWEIVTALTSDFYSGYGAKDNKRTMFVVGDEKQSIYSFQGADPQEFDKQRKALQTRTKNIDEETKNISLSLSFRSTEEVLNAVDTVFSLPENAKGLIQDGNVSSHTANRASDIGEVSIWPLIEKPEKIKKTEWLDPYDKLQEENAEVVLAKRISKQIKQWLDKGEKLPGRGERISAGDILILVRKRDLFASAITRELKRANLPTAGADRLKLTEHILVEDMMALGRFAMMQIDDLALAGLLKSPLFDLSEEELFELANLRGAATLHDAIYSNSDKYSAALLSKLEPIKTNISQILQDARNKPAFEFYADLFATHDLRKRYLQQMGSEAEEVIDGFLQAALNHDIKSASGIIDFIEWLSNAEPEIKREIDLEANEIRVITVHSSKGLEKPIVFLVDPGSKVFDTGKHMPKIASLKDNKGNNAFIWQPKTENHIEETQAFRDKVEQDAEDEYRRLLYVGMTRAADKLIVCGYGKNDAPHNHWHKMVKRGLVDGNSGRANGKLIDEIQNEEIVAQHWKIENPLHKERAQKEKPVVEPATAHKAQWLFEAAKPEYLAPKPLTPSGVLGLSQIDDEKDRSQDVGSKNALNKGNAIHRLLQIVPDIEPQKRDALFESFFKNHQIDFTSTNEKEIRSSVEQIMNDENLSELFGANSRAEISISGEVTLADGKTHLVNGQIDRLVIGEGIVKIFDYKTNYQVPKNPYEVSSNYVAQMALYRELIKQIYDQKKVVCSIIWTQTGELMCLTDDILDKQLAQLTNT